MFKKRLLPVFVAMAATGSLPAQAQDSSDSALEEEIIVTGVRNAELNARQSERNKNIFSSVISQDDAGDFADQNVAESLQRLPGITLQKTEGEGRFVSVRGLGPGFVTVQQNGAELASAGSDDRSFALDSIPADLLGSIEVFKSLTPDMDLNSIGGAVNVKTVSAFDRKRDSLRLTVQGSYQENAEEYSPKVSLQGTNLFADDRIGIGYSLSWEKRKTETYEVLHHETNDMRFIQQDLPNIDPVEGDPATTMLIPFEFQNRQETAERTRIGGSFDVGFRPTDNSEYYVRSSYTELEDLDLAWREYYRFGQAQADDIVYVDPASGIFGVVDADIQQQMFIQEGTSSTTALSAGGKNIFDMSSGDLTFDYEYAWSEGEFEKPDGKRVQFRERDLPLIGKAGKEYMVGQAVSPLDLAALAGVNIADLPAGQYSGYTNNGVQLSGFDYDNLFIENSGRLDELSQISANIQKDFNEGFVSYIKAGFAIKNRERERNQDRWSLTPASFSPSCNESVDVDLCRQWIVGSLDDFTYANVNHPDFAYPAITQSSAEELISVTRAIATPNAQQGLESVYRDYTLTEDTAAAYLMGEFRLSDNQSLITGVRWEETEFSSTGYFAINNDNFDIGDGSAVSFDYSIPLEGATSKYDDLFPSIHYRYEPREDILVRASVWTSFTRPSFDQARAFATIDSSFELCNPATGICSTTPAETVPEGDPVPSPEELRNFTLGSDNTLNFGNPGLVAMNSTNFDASIGWYASDDLFLQAALFYKDIDDFIVDVSGSTIALNELPIDLPVDQVDAFVIPEDLVMNNVNWTTNGDKAKVYGIELSYNQYFESGLFIQSNATFMNSEASVGETIRANDIQLPDQADTTVNLTVGWENEEVSLRLINNYRSKILDRIGSCPAGSEGYIIPVSTDDRPTCKEWADIYHDATYSLDFKATYQINKDIKIYFDALNLTDEYSVYYFQGNEYSQGKSLYHSEVYGRSFQFGVNYKFM